MSQKALRYCLRQVIRIVDLMEEDEVDKALTTLYELVLFIAEQLTKVEAEG